MYEKSSVVSGSLVNLSPVCIHDASYILSLRQNHELSTYLSPVEDDLLQQQDWIHSYLQRQAKGKEHYYLVKNMQGESGGTVRLYNIDAAAGTFSFGSFIIDPEASLNRLAALESVILILDFAFNHLSLSTCYFDCRRKNRQANAFYQRFGAKQINADNKNFYYAISNDEFSILKQRHLPALQAEQNHGKVRRFCPDRQLNEVKKETKAAVDRVLQSGRYILGPELEAFEEEYARFCGTSYCVGVGSGLAALTLALKAMQLPSGSEVVVPVNSFIASAFAVSNSGLKPVFADVNPHSFLLDAASVSKVLTPKTSAIMPVHLYGYIAPMKELTAAAETNGLKIIEDAAQAHGAIYEHKRAGSIGHCGAFSFYPTKNLGALGDGGAIVANDKAFVQQLKSLRNYGSSQKHHHEVIGENSRLSEIQAAFLRVQLRYLDQHNAMQHKIASFYRNAMTNEKVVLPQVLDEAAHVWHQFVIRVPAAERKLFLAHLEAKGVDASIHYPVSIHKQPAYKEYNALAFPVAETLAREIISLPCHPFLTEEEKERIVDAVNTFRFKSEVNFV